MPIHLRYLPYALLLTLLLGSGFSLADSNMSLWFQAPASDWEREGLPIGNGAMGAVVTGELREERLQFNEKTLWEGGPGSRNGWDWGQPSEAENYLQKLHEIQQELNEKLELTPEYVADKLGRDIKGYGNYQSFGDVTLSYSGLENISNYRRALDISTGIATVSFNSDDTHYTREYFVSYPDRVIVLRLRADKQSAINVTVGLQPSSGRSVTREHSDNGIRVFGAQDENGLHYEAQLRVIAQSGSLNRSGDRLQIQNADSVLILLVAGTDYAQKFPTYRGELPHVRLSADLNRAAAKGVQALFDAHTADHQALFNRVKLNLHAQLPDKSIDKLLQEYTASSAEQDLALENLYFQYGRYLLIGSSRPGSLPANLQGVWNHSNTPPWNADYHVNINLQMNYWPADVTNLGELNAPLFDFIDSLIEPGTLAAQKMLGSDGWTLFLNTNIYGFTGVIKWPTAFWQPEAGAWLAQHYYEHYLFTGDKQFLRERAYPAMQGAAELWLDALVEDPRDGSLVVNPSYSPEHGGFTAAAAMSQQTVWDVFNNCYEAAQILGDKNYAQRVKAALDKLDPGMRVGKWGQLQEWKIDLDDPQDQHRHISQLYALHPGRQISPVATPKLAAAARKTLEGRGDAGTGWSKAWKVNLWARLLDGDRAHKLLGEQLIHSTLPNMWDNHPPFQIDGNFGATAGVAEMLLQSHNREIHLLPALPSIWADGEISGLVARGKVVVDMQWQAGKLRRALLQPAHSSELHVRVDGAPEKLAIYDLQRNKKIRFKRESDLLSFKAKAGRRYELRMD